MISRDPKPSMMPTVVICAVFSPDLTNHNIVIFHRFVKGLFGVGDNRRQFTGTGTGGGLGAGLGGGLVGGFNRTCNVHLSLKAGGHQSVSISRHLTGR